MTHEIFLSRLSPNREYDILEEYVGYELGLIVENKYGRCLMKPSALLNGYNPSIRSAISPHEYFYNTVKERNSYYEKGEIEMVSKFVNDAKKIIVKTKRGEHLITPYSLFHNHLPNIKTAIDKNTYLKNQFHEIHEIGTFDYSKINFNTHKKHIVIGCNKCGLYFNQSPDHHYRGYGCPDCSNENKGYKFSNWLNSCKGEKGKFYMIRCFNKNEEFIKIGITCQTVYVRYNSFVRMPYSYEILNVIESEDRKEIWQIEKKLKIHLKKEGFAYSPLIYFAGATSEVFESNNNVINKINEEISNFGGGVKFG